MAHHILIADDDADIRTVLSSIVKSSGVGDPVTACDGAEAAEMIMREQPEAAILDAAMPRMTGIDLVQWMEERGIAFPVVVYSGHPIEAAAFPPWCVVALKGAERIAQTLPSLIARAREKWDRYMADEDAQCGALASQVNAMARNVEAARMQRQNAKHARHA